MVLRNRRFERDEKMSTEKENNGFEIEIKIEIKNSEEPDIDEMDANQLRDYLAELEAQLEELDDEEPEDDESEEYDEWAEKHEAIEDMIDDINDRLEELAD